MANQFLTLDYGGHEVTQGPGSVIENVRVELRDGRKSEEQTYISLFGGFFFIVHVFFLLCKVDASATVAPAFGFK